MELAHEVNAVRPQRHAKLNHLNYNGRRHYVYDADGEQIGKRRLKDKPGQPRKRWESQAAFDKRSRKALQGVN